MCADRFPAVTFLSQLQVTLSLAKSLRVMNCNLMLLQMLGFAKAPPNRTATYRMTVKRDMETDLTEGVYRMRCNRHSESS
jgi:hypothetical protein